MKLPVSGRPDKPSSTRFAHDSAHGPLDVYAVNYPASDEWATGVEGIRDASAHVVSMVQNCPTTKMVLSGFSQGAAVMGFVTSAAVPDGVDPATVPKPLAPEVADHVAAVVLFAVPNVRAMNFLDEPPVVIGPTYDAKTLKVCAVDDAVCSDGLNFAAHDTYTQNADLVRQGVDFAPLGSVRPTSAAPGSTHRRRPGCGAAAISRRLGRHRTCDADTDAGTDALGVGRLRQWRSDNQLHRE